MPLLGLTIVASDQDTAYQIGVMITQEIHKELSGPRSGKWYPVPGNMFYDATIQKNASKQNKTHNYGVKYTGTYNRGEILGSAYQASAPGEPPAVRTGRLRQSFFMDVRKQATKEWIVNIRTNVFYADDLEKGTIKISPRPYISTVLQRLSPTINHMRVKSFLKVLRI